MLHVRHGQLIDPQKKVPANQRSTNKASFSKHIYVVETAVSYIAAEGFIGKIRSSIYETYHFRKKILRIYASY